jgi:DNA-binding response OmpR family regulator
MPKKILIVEDDFDLRSVYKTVLELKNHTVETAIHGAEALQKLQTFTPDIILLDALMPEMDGLEFLQQYKPATKTQTDVYVLSNLSHETIVFDMLAAGASEAFIKAEITPNFILELADR